jgi:hypothetical protein
VICHVARDNSNLVEKDGYSIDHVTKYIDGMDPHYCSGILNRVSCHLTTHSDMSWKDVFRIFTFANRFYWHSTISFNEAGCGVLKAAYDLAHRLVPLQDALDQVGIVPCDMTNHIRILHGHMSISGLDAPIKPIRKSKYSKYVLP